MRLIQSIYDLGLEPVFWSFEAKQAVAPKQFSFDGFSGKAPSRGKVRMGGDYSGIATLPQSKRLPQPGSLSLSKNIPGIPIS